MSVRVKIVCFSVLLCVRHDSVLDRVSVCMFGQSLNSYMCLYMWTKYCIM